MILLMNPALLAWGNPVPGRWEKVAQSKLGEKLIIYTEDGAKKRLLYVQIDDDDLLHCVNNYGGKVSIDLITIDKIIVPKAGKYAKRGALWGAVGGAALPGIPFIIGQARGGGGEFTGLGQVMIVSVTAGIGALGGFLAGASLGAPGETVYISKELAMKEARK